MKKFIIGIIIGGTLTTSVTALAATVKNMQAVYSVQKLVVKGIDTGKGSTAFVSEGTTYVPLRTVSDALGHEISWDTNTKTIYINSNNNSNNVSGEPTDLPAASSGVTTPTPAPTVTTPTPAPTVTTPTYSVGNGTWNGQKLISIATAKQAAIKAVGGGTVIWQEADIYEYDDLPTYDFKILKNNRVYEVEINALTGTVKDFEIDD